MRNLILSILLFFGFIFLTSQMLVNNTLRINNPYAVILDTNSQAIVNKDIVQAVRFSNNDALNKVTHPAGDSIITIQENGTYRILISAIGDITGGAGNKHLELFLRVNGNIVANSNTILEIPSITTEMVLAVEFINTFVKGDYFEIVISGDATTIELSKTSAKTAPVRPLCPSIILTMNKFGE